MSRNNWQTKRIYGNQRKTRRAGGQINFHFANQIYCTFVIELMPGPGIWNSWMVGCTIYGPGDGRGLIANISSRDSSNPN